MEEAELTLLLENAAGEGRDSPFCLGGGANGSGKL